MENRKIRIDQTAALIRNHAEKRAGNYIALKLPRKKNTKKYMQIFGEWKVENRKIRIDRTAALIRNHAERRAGNYIALKLPRKKTTKKEKERKRNTKKEKYKEIYANFWGVEGGKPENPDRPDRCAHPEPCGEESGQLYCPETTKKEKYRKGKMSKKRSKGRFYLHMSKKSSKFAA